MELWQGVPRERRNGLLNVLPESRANVRPREGENACDALIENHAEGI